MKIKSSSDGTIILFPDYQKLRESVESLREELTRLYQEMDTLVLIECRRIEMSYMLQVGGLEYQAYKLECGVLRLKRKMQLIQAKKNRQEKVDPASIEQTLDHEFAEYQESLNDQLDRMNEALELSRCRELTDEESAELKKLYRDIVKALHPDLHPDSSENRLRLFQSAVDAYENGDLSRIRTIAAMACGPDLSSEKNQGLSALMNEEERLKTLIQEVNDNTARIKTEYPYIMKELLEDDDALTARQKELNDYICGMRETLDLYSARVREMME
ncbi:MAG: J domain-containing protein [Eubacteriaceae bacterium]|jgi:methyl-accepting chemotaxis protein